MGIHKSRERLLGCAVANGPPASLKFHLLPSQAQDMVVILTAGGVVPQLAGEELCMSLAQQTCNKAQTRQSGGGCNFSLSCRHPKVVLNYCPGLKNIWQGLHLCGPWSDHDMVW